MMACLNMPMRIPKATYRLNKAGILLKINFRNYSSIANFNKKIERKAPALSFFMRFSGHRRRDCCF